MLCCWHKKHPSLLVIAFLLPPWRLHSIICIIAIVFHSSVFFRSDDHISCVRGVQYSLHRYCEDSKYWPRAKCNLDRATHDGTRGRCSRRHMESLLADDLARRRSHLVLGLPQSSRPRRHHCSHWTCSGSRCQPSRAVGVWPMRADSYSRGQSFYSTCFLITILITIALTGSWRSSPRRIFDNWGCISKFLWVAILYIYDYFFQAITVSVAGCYQHCCSISSRRVVCVLCATSQGTSIPSSSMEFYQKTRHVMIFRISHWTNFIELCCQTIFCNLCIYGKSFGLENWYTETLPHRSQFSCNP